MDRRSVLQGAVGLATVALAGCLGGDEEEFTLNVVDYDFGENETGHLETTAVVSNTGNEPQDGTLYVRADVDDDSLVRVRDVSLDAHETREYAITYDIEMETVSNFSMDVEIEPKDG
ncbi:MAG: hypothetical protein ACOCSP_00705 [archaeon]